MFQEWLNEYNKIINNGGNMEEDIKTLEELRKELGLYANGNKIKQGQALENLIKAYKELEYKYNKALSDLVQAEHKNKELNKEKIKI